MCYKIIWRSFAMYRNDALRRYCRGLTAVLYPYSLAGTFAELVIYLVVGRCFVMAHQAEFERQHRCCFRNLAADCIYVKLLVGWRYMRPDDFFGHVRNYWKNFIQE